MNSLCNGSFWIIIANIHILELKHANKIFYSQSFQNKLILSVDTVFLWFVSKLWLHDKTLSPLCFLTPLLISEVFFKSLSRCVLFLVRTHNPYLFCDTVKYWKGTDLKTNIHCSSRSNTSSWQILCLEIGWASEINGSFLAVLSFCMEAELRNSCLKSLKVPHSEQDAKTLSDQSSL